jgi:hypothetical protein
MRIVKLSPALGLLLCAAPCLLADPPETKGRVPAKENLTPDTLTKFQALIRPHENEWRHLRVHWLTDIVAARKKAAAEDKPIIVLRTGGAGYNDPLGAC